MITFRTVTKRFGEAPPALDQVSFHVEPGEFVFLTGHSGSGKTTLLKLLTKEYTPTEGEIEFQGNLLSGIRRSQLHRHRRQIGVVFQDCRLLPDLNVWENIALALQIIGKKQTDIEERVTDLLELVGLTDKAYLFPIQLSGGESQRIGIARALATAPSVLLADEPTGNLDPQNTMMIARLFDRINSLGTTVLFATHDTTILSSLSHRRLVLDKGRIMSDTGVGAKPAVKPTQPAAPVSQSAPKKETTKAEDFRHGGPENNKGKPEANQQKPAPSAVPKKSWLARLFQKKNLKTEKPKEGAEERSFSASVDRDDKARPENDTAKPKDTVPEVEVEMLNEDSHHGKPENDHTKHVSQPKPDPKKKAAL